MATVLLLIEKKLAASIDADDECIDLLFHAWYLDDGVLAASHHSGAAANGAELRKLNANSTKCTELGWTCIPMAVETFGHWASPSPELQWLPTFMDRLHIILQGEYSATPTPDALSHWKNASDTLRVKLQLLLIYKHHQSGKNKEKGLSQPQHKTESEHNDKLRKMFHSDCVSDGPCRMTCVMSKRIQSDSGKNVHTDPTEESYRHHLTAAWNSAGQGASQNLQIGIPKA
eukprot:Em0348g2a